MLFEEAARCSASFEWRTLLRSLCPDNLSCGPHAQGPLIFQWTSAPSGNGCHQPSIAIVLAASILGTCVTSSWLTGLSLRLKATVAMVRVQ
ncbi:unnamed protein product [Clonostachys rosea f. rosea IK726]|uniref:Uncharacterized protein n=1 Tax=Clonostachys rosea f. rosea IK726 TaxID=1349383 RepID=A0ACA9TYI5_BIOOC|nr:unnamed protein product [Clonostachys rosea f. rosea IK726]